VIAQLASGVASLLAGALWAAPCDELAGDFGDKVAGEGARFDDGDE
jgi:hypothetical protein